MQNQPSKNLVAKWESFIIAYTFVVQLRYGWSRLGSAEWFQLQPQKLCLLTEALWLDGVALLHMSLILLGQLGLQRQVLLVMMAEIQKSKLHLTSIFEAIGYITMVDETLVRLSHRSKKSQSVGKWTLALGHGAGKIHISDQSTKLPTS